MEQIGTVFGWKMAAVFLVLFGLACCYAWFVYKFLPERKIRVSSAELVIGGTLGTLIGYGFIVGWHSTVYGWEAIISILLSFIVSGLPMSIGYIWYETQVEKQDEIRTKEYLNRLNEQAKNMVKK